MNRSTACVKYLGIFNIAGNISDDEMDSILNIRKDWQDNKEALRRQVSSQLESCFN